MTNIGVGIAIGVGLGVGIGAGMNNMGVGIAIGVALGVVFGSIMQQRQQRMTANQEGDEEATATQGQQSQSDQNDGVVSDNVQRVQETRGEREMFKRRTGCYHFRHVLRYKNLAYSFLALLVDKEGFTPSLQQTPCRN